MESHCLNHQGTVATKRCTSCSIPLCDVCATPYPEGVFCSARCHQSAQEGVQRAAQLAREEAELRQWRQKRAAVKMITWVVVGCALFFGWDYFPPAFTDKVEALWKSVKSAF